MKNSLTLIVVLISLVGNYSALSQKKEVPVSNAFSERIFEGKGYQPIGNLKWKYKTQGKIFSSPLAKNGLVYIGSADGGLYAIDEKSGNLKWKFKTAGAIHSSPSLLNNILYFGSFDGHYYAINALTGTLVWKFRTGGEHWLGEMGMWGMKPSTQYMEDLWDFYLSSPVVYEGPKTKSVLFGSSDGHIYCVQAKTGKLIWKFKTAGPVHSTAVIDQNKIYIGSWDATLYALNITTGKEVWRFATGTQTGFKGIQSTVAVDDGKVYFGTREPFFFALDAQTGNVIWEYDAENSWILSSAVTQNNTVYVGTSDTYALLALDAITGAEKYRFKANGYIYSSPAIAGNTLYFGDFTGNFYALNLLSQGKEYNYVSTDHRKKFATTILKNNALDFTHAANDNDLTLYDNNKKVMNQFYKLGPIVSSPFINSNSIYFGSADGNLYAYHLEKNK